jgi:hypothetical protein
VKFAHLNHLPKMVKKFEHERGHKMWKRKAHIKKSIKST